MGVVALKEFAILGPPRGLDDSAILEDQGFDGSDVPGLIFYGFHRFYMILDGSVWISWNPGAPGRAPCGIGLDGSRGPKSVCNLGTPRGLDDSMIRG